MKLFSNPNPQKHRRMALGAGRDKPWGVWRWFHIGDYLHRLKIVTTPYGSLYLHKMMSPDRETVLHDHPWNFVSVVLAGGYWEVYMDPMTREVKSRHITRFNIKRTHDAHYIRSLDQKPTWTLVLIGRRHRTWGFLRILDPRADWYIAEGESKSGWSWNEFDSDGIHAQRLNES